MKIRILFFLLFSGFVTLAQNQTNIPSTDGVVHTLQVSGDTLYLGGNFSRIYTEGSTAYYGGIVDKSTGRPLETSFKADNEVRVAIADGDGGFIIGGRFTRIGDSTRMYLAHLDANGKLTARFSGISLNGVVHTLAISGDTLFAGGEFTSVNGNARSRVALLSMQSGTLFPATITANNTVRKIHVAGGVIYLGGIFDNLNSTTRMGLGAVQQATMILSTWNPSTLTGNQIHDIESAGDLLFVAGTFANIGGKTRNRFAVISKSTGVADNWDLQPSDVVNDISLFGDTMVIAGKFSLIASSSRYGLALFSIKNKAILPANFLSNANTQATCSFIEGNSLYTGWIAPNSIATANPCFLKFDLATLGQLKEWLPGVPTSGLAATTLVGSGSNLFIGSNIPFIGGMARRNLAAIRISSGELLTWTPQPNNEVTNLALAPGNKLMITGLFDTIFQTRSPYLATLSRSAATVASPSVSVNGKVTSLAFSGNTLALAGNFTLVNGQTKPVLASVDFTTGVLNPQTYLASPSGILINSIKAASGVLYVGGNFNTTIFGRNRKYGMSFDIASGALLDWNPQADGIVQTLLVDEDRVYLGGAFTSVDNQAGAFFAVTDTSLGKAKPTKIAATAQVSAICIKDNILYLNAGSTSPGRAPQQAITSLNKQNLDHFPWYAHPGATQSIEAMQAEDRYLFMAGSGGVKWATAPNGYRWSVSAVQHDTLLHMDSIPVKTFCAGNVLDIAFADYRGADLNNQYQVELSDSSGSFSQVTVIGSRISTRAGNISCTIPMNSPASSKYRIRIHASMPERYSADNGYNLTISAPHLVRATSDSLLSQCHKGHRFIFRDSSSAAGTTLTRLWRFSDNTTASTSIVTKSFSNPGTAYARLVSTTASGCKDSVTLNLQVYSQPGAVTQPAGVVDLCVRDSFLLTANAGNGFQYLWLDSNEAPQTTDGSAYFKRSGKYRVIVTDAHQCKDTSAVVTANISEVPLPRICVNRDQQCFKHNSFEIADTSLFTSGTLSRLWKISGTTSGSAKQFTKSFNAAGHYPLKLFVTGSNGCEDSTALDLTVFNKLEAQLATSGNVKLCRGQTVMLKANEQNKMHYQWRRGNTPVETDTALITAAVTGDYSVIVKDSNACSDTSFLIPVRIETQSAGFTIGSPLSQCLKGNSFSIADTSHSTIGSATTQTWYFNDTVVSGTANLTASFSTSGSKTIKLVTNAEGCLDSASRQILLYPQPGATITANGKINFCEGDSLRLSANSGAGYRYKWTRTFPAMAPGDTLPDYQVKVDGDYQVVVSTFNGCSDTSSVWYIYLNPLPSRPTILRSNDSLWSSLQAAGYQWYNNQQIIPGATGRYYNPPGHGQYQVEVYNDSGCHNLSKVLSFVHSGVNETEETTAALIYPNPLSGDLFSIGCTQPVLAVEIHDAQGRRVRDFYFAETEKTVKLQVVPGLYLISIETAQGWISKRLVVQSGL